MADTDSSDDDSFASVQETTPAERAERDAALEPEPEPERDAAVEPEPEPGPGPEREREREPVHPSRSPRSASAAAAAARAAALSPSAIDEDLASQMEALEADLRQQQRDLECRRRFLSLRPVFRGLFKMFCSDQADPGVDGSVELPTLEGLGQTLFPGSSALPAGAAGAVLWSEFIRFMEASEHIPKTDDDWGLLMEKLAMLDIRVPDQQQERQQEEQQLPTSLVEVAEAAAAASWTTEPGLREEHVEALAQPSPRGRPQRGQSRSDLTADEIVGGSGSTRDELDTEESAGASDPHEGQPAAAPDTIGRVESQVRKKDTRDLERLVYCQRLAGHEKAVWAMRFSPDGRWLATGGQDTVVRVWKAQMWNESSSSDDSPCATGGGDSSRCGSPEPGDGKLPPAALAARRAFDPEPAFELRGHQHDVLDLAWSRDSFLLSASMDATVKLWHTSTSVCLRTYQHSDFVTSVQFVPSDDTMFLTGRPFSCLLAALLFPLKPSPARGLTSKHCPFRHLTHRHLHPCPQELCLVSYRFGTYLPIASWPIVKCRSAFFASFAALLFPLKPSPARGLTSKHCPFRHMTHLHLHLHHAHRNRSPPLRSTPTEEWLSQEALMESAHFTGWK